MDDVVKLKLINDHRVANGREPVMSVSPPATLDSEIDRIHEIAQYGADPFADEDVDPGHRPLGRGMEITKLEYDCGDKRSGGSLKVEATTEYGLLQVEGTIGSDSSLDEVKVTIDGIEVDDEDDEFPDPGLPHYYAPDAMHRRVDVRAQVTEAIEGFLAEYGKHLAHLRGPRPA